MLLSMLLSIIVSHVYASHAGEEVSVSGLMLKTLFKATKTNVLEMHQCFGADWLEYYNLSLTKRSVDEFGSFLLKCAVEGPHNDSDSNDISVVNAESQMELCASLLPEQGPATSSQGGMVEMIQQALVERSFPVQRTLMRYAIYKVFLYGHLGRNVREILYNIFSADHPGLGWIKLLQFIDKLSLVKSHGGLFAALAVGWGDEAVRAAWEGLGAPEAITKLIDAYVQEYEGKYVSIPHELFSRLSPECQYRLARTCKLEPYHRIIDWRAFYFLSRFSNAPSEEIRIACLEKDVRLPRYGGDDESLTVLEALAADVDGSNELPKILDRRSYPWKYMFKSRLDIFRYILSLNLPLQNAARFGRQMGWAWTNTIGREISETRPLMSLKAYSDLYVCYCKAAGRHYLEYTGMCPLEAARNPALVLHQWFGMSEENYAEVVRIIVEVHNMTPMIPLEYWTNNSGKLMHVLEECGDLVNRLLEKGDCDSLLSELFLRRVHIPPKAAAVFETKTALYRLLFWKDGGIRGYLGEMFEIYCKPLPNWTLPSIVIKSCMLLKPNDGPEVLELLRKEIQRCLEADGRRSIWHSPVMLIIPIMKSLLKHRKNYNEEELGTVEKVLEQYVPCDKDSMRGVFLECIDEFSKCPQLAVKLMD